MKRTRFYTQETTPATNVSSHERSRFPSTQPRKGKNLSLHRGIPDCGRCGLYKEVHSPRMKMSGEGRKELFILAEAPGAEEDYQGTQLVGKIGAVFQNKLNSFGIDLDKDCWKLNAINCRPTHAGNNREPKPIEINCCRPMVEHAIQKTKPKVILLLGNSAVHSLIGHRWKKDLGTISKWRGWAIPDQELKAWIVPTFHPSYIERQKSISPVAGRIFDQDVRLAIDLLSTPFPDYGDETSKITILPDYEVVHWFLTHRDSPLMGKHEVMCFDYETTGLKPYASGHAIVTCSFAFDEDHAYAFNVTEEVKPYLKRVLCDHEIRKIAHNIKYEEEWTRALLGAPVKNWHWDTMTTAHVLDNRTGITSLKFQTYVHFGVIDYASDILPYIETNKKNPNDFNQITEAPRDKLLIYNGMDSMFGFRLFRKQREEILTRGLEKPNDFFLEGSIAFADMQVNGVCVDTQYFKAQQKRLKDRSDYLNERINELPEVKEWAEKQGKNGINIKSPLQLRSILFDHCGLSPIAQTEKGNDKTDRDTLIKLSGESRLATDIIEIRRLSKMVDTYLPGILRSNVEGILHPELNLHIPRTYRGSCDSPNLQNIPYREERVKKIIRKGFLSRQGHLWLEPDFSGIEVCIAACVTKDPQLIKDITDPERDMHRDMSMECFILEEDEWTDMTRFCAKNGFVFPQFYGSYFVEIANNMWEMIEMLNLKTKQEVPLYDHLKKHGIRTEAAFEKHIEGIEKYFWEERYPVYGKWRVNRLKQYDLNGKLTMLTGFECSGVMRRNEIWNYPIQGPAFHCLLWSVIEMRKELERNNMRTKSILQIHDSMILDTDPEELNWIANIAKEIMTVRLPGEWNWIIVPLSIGMEAAPVNQSWYYKQKLIKEPCTCGNSEWKFKEEGCPLCYEEKF